MSALLSHLLARFSEGQLAGFLLVLGRVSPLFVLAPMFSSRMVPPRVRGIAAVAVAIGLTPLALGHRAVPTDPLTLAGLMGKEVLVGLAFSFALAALFAALSSAGALLDTQIGFSFGSLVDPVTGTQSSVLANLYALIGVMVFIAIGGDTWLLQGLARTYDLVGLLSWPALGALVSGAAGAFVGVLTAALEIAAPVLLAVIVTDAAFGLVSRVVPQLNVFAVGFPAKVVVGPLVLGISLPFLAGWLPGQLQDSVASALHALRIA